MNQSSPDPHGQTQYQVRFDWGIDGAMTIGRGADVVVWVDAVASASPPPTLDARVAVLGSFRNRTAVARWVLARQGDKGDRFVVAVVAAGAERPTGSIRFALEDLLAAGAIIDALADVGIDYCSPESAAASAAFVGTRHALGPLVEASGTGQEVRQWDDLERQRHEPDLMRWATILDAESAVEGMHSTGAAFEPVGRTAPEKWRTP